MPRGPRAYVPSQRDGDRRPREIVRALLEAGASVDHVDTRGACALMMVAGDTTLVRMMLGAGADASRTDAAGRSVLMLCMEKQVGVVADVVGYGMSKLRGDESVSDRERTRELTTSVAASWGEHLKVVTDLLSNGADVRGAPVLLSALQGYVELHTHLAREVFSSGTYGTYHVRSAALNGHWEVLRAILDSDACPPHHADAKGNTALHLACQAGHTDAVRAMAVSRGGGGA
ncbi:ankyrin repeat-containing domain protein, partial [Baffinella frigidus]